MIIHWLQAGTVGIFFGSWPLIANVTGLKGNASVFYYGLVGLLISLPITWKDLPTIGQARWGLGIIAGSVAVCGSLLFNDLISKVPKHEISTLIVVALITNAIIQGINHAVRNGGLSADRGWGFVLAAAAIYFLLKK